MLLLLQIYLMQLFSSLIQLYILAANLQPNAPILAVEADTRLIHNWTGNKLLRRTRQFTGIEGIHYEHSLGLILKSSPKVIFKVF